jgi:ATP-dependent protease HslVU (ClpYQ) peptidase subunit
VLGFWIFVGVEMTIISAMVKQESGLLSMHIASDSVLTFGDDTQANMSAKFVRVGSHKTGYSIGVSGSIRMLNLVSRACDNSEFPMEAHSDMHWLQRTVDVILDLTEAECARKRAVQEDILDYGVIIASLLGVYLMFSDGQVIESPAGFNAQGSGRAQAYAAMSAFSRCRCGAKKMVVEATKIAIEGRADCGGPVHYERYSEDGTVERRAFRYSL